VNQVKERLNDADLVLFEYHPYSVPFAVDNRTPVLGLGQRATHRWPDVLAWLCAEAETNMVMVITPWACPAIEAGVQFEPAFSVTGQFSRVRAKTSLPAKYEQRNVVLHAYRIDSLRLGDVPKSCEKIMDGGVIGIRGGWGRSGFHLTSPEGERLPAVWTIEGSQVVGPVPPPGSSVQLTVVGSSSQKDATAKQALLIIPPWSGAPTEVIVSNGYCNASVVLQRPVSESESCPSTGLYTLHTAIPYDPASEGIRGFRKDLGILLHCIRFVVEAAE
jgi:hypothetical protein